MNQQCLILPIILLLASCGENENGSTDSTLLDLEGKWLSGCYMDDPEGFNFFYNKKVVTFSGSTFERSYPTWNNSSCSGDPIMSGTMIGTYTIGETVITGSGLEAVEIDLNYGAETTLNIIRKVGEEVIFGVTSGFYPNSHPNIVLGLNRASELNFDDIYTQQ